MFRDIQFSIHIGLFRFIIQLLFSIAVVIFNCSCQFSIAVVIIFRISVPRVQSVVCQPHCCGQQDTAGTSGEQK